MKSILAVLMLVSMLVAASELTARPEHRDRDGADARIDAMLGTPNRQTPTPQAPTTTPTTPTEGKDAPDPSKK